MAGSLDGIDEQILALVERDARLPIAEIGRRVGLSRTATLARLRRLETDGVVRGYHATVVRPREGPLHRARVALTVSTRDAPAYVRRLRSTLGDALEEVESVAGEYDLLLGVAVHHPTELDRLLDAIAGWKETVRTTTFVVLRRL